MVVFTGTGTGDTITGTAGADSILGLAGNDSLIGVAGNDTIDGGIGADDLVGGLGNDTYLVDNRNDILNELVAQGTDTVKSTIDFTLAGNFENLTLLGNATIAEGNALKNTIKGNDYKNIIDGKAGIDKMYGLGGNDIYYVDNSADVAVEAVNAGIDTVISSSSYTLGVNVEKLTLSGTANTKGTGNTLSNVIIGNSGDNYLSGGSGDDILAGGAGNDTADGGSGNDIIDGGIGNDTNNTYKTRFIGGGNDIVNGQAKLVITNTDVQLGNIVAYLYGNDLILTYERNKVDSITIKDFFTDSSPFIVGSDDPAIIQDSIYYDSNNTYYKGSLNGRFQIFYKDSQDNIYAQPSRNPDENHENDIVTDYTLSPNYTAFQAKFDNNFKGFRTNAANTYTYVYDSFNQSFVGINEHNSGGTLIAEYRFQENDQVYSYEKTLYTYNSVGAVISRQEFDYDSAGQLLTSEKYTGVDFVHGVTWDGPATISVDLPDIQFGVNGNFCKSYSKTDNTTLAISNLTTGESSDMTLSYSVLTEGDLEGDYVGSLQVIGESEGNQVLQQYYNTDGKLVYTRYMNNDGTSDVELYFYYDNGTLSEKQEISIDELDNITDSRTINYYYQCGQLAFSSETGENTVTNYYSDILSSTDTFTGTTRSDLITGNIDREDTINGGGGNDLILSYTGDDSIYGGTGADTMYGGDGNDTYYVDNKSDIIAEFSGESSGTDLCYSSVSYTISNDVENLILKGTAITGAGNASDNSIMGNSYNNTLDGGLGVDILVGGSGNDTYLVDNADDVIIEYAGKGTDTVKTTVDYFLADNLENITLLGTSDHSISGNSLNNIIIGNSGDNILSGQEGNDKLDGGAESDILSGGVGNDTYIFDPGDGRDTISEESGTDKISFNKGIVKGQIALFKAEDSDDLIIDYGTGVNTGRITIQNHFVEGNSVEKLQLSNGTYLSTANINHIIDDITQFAPDHSIQISSIDNVKSNAELMAQIATHWHS